MSWTGDWLHRDRSDGSGPSVRRGLVELIDGFLFSRARSTCVAPHVRDSMNTQRFVNAFVVATIPCWLIGLWNLGEQINLAMEIRGLAVDPGWRGSIINALGVGYDPLSAASNLVHGFLYFLPLFLISLGTGSLLEALFAKYRRLPVDDGLLMTAWLYTLMLPSTAPPLIVAAGMAFGLVFGKLIFGGTGRYVVSPALLGIGFLVFSYSMLLFAPGAWIPVPGYDEPTAVELAIDEGGVSALLSVNYTWLQLFLGNQPGPVGVTSILGCLLGGAYLVVCGIANWRIIAGSFAGMIATVLLFNAFGPADDPNFAVPWYWHMVLGGWAFGTMFLATDPVAAATTNPGRWAYGVFIGAITVVVRVTNPSYYDGMLFAILLGSIFAPLFDYVVVERNIKRRARRLAEST